MRLDDIHLALSLRTPRMNALIGRTSRLAAMTAGALAAGAALGVGELVASLRGHWESPVVGVAGAVIERVPRPVKDFGVERFGTNDKLALIIGILVLSFLFALLLGLIARRRPMIAVIGLAAFAFVGVWGSQQSVNATPSSIVPSVCAGVAGVTALCFLLRIAATLAPAPAAAPAAVIVTPGPHEPVGTGSRRAFLLSSAGLAAVAAGAAAGGRSLRTRFSAASSRRALVLPAAADPLPAPSSGVILDVPGVRSFFTRNRDFYRIDTAVQVPQIRAEDWSLRIHGMVDRDVRFAFDDIVSMDLVEKDITLTCVSNTVGGSLVGTARWLGVPLLDLLDRAGVDPAANQLVGRSTDGWTSGLPIEILDGRPALLAIGMNGEPLPLAHGFPARMIVSGLHGYVSATKWITELEVTTFDAFDGYWVKRGWDERAPIKTMSRIDTPRTLAKVAEGTVNIGGVAWAQTVGIAEVEIKIDDGEWAVATLADEQSVDTWRLWSMPWEGATPGRHRITVRATDRNGHLQSEERADPFPNGASGWMSIFVDVTDS